MLYAAEVILAMQCFAKTSRGRLLLWIVAAMLLMNGAGTTIILINTWLSLISFFGRRPPNDAWSMPVIIITRCVVSVMEKCLLIKRFQKLSKNQLATIFLFIMVGMHALFDILTVIHAMITRIQITPLGNIAILVSGSFSTALDVMIPLTLIWLLNRISPKSASTERLIYRSLINAISTGGLGAVVGVALFILILLKNEASFVLLTSIGHIYSITVLVNLLIGSSNKAANTATSDPNRSDVEEIGLVVRRVHVFNPDNMVRSPNRIILDERNGSQETKIGHDEPVHNPFK
ncbi:hypothetical protein BDQ12DRAFT_712971 [Crucibulum laeve]|uniref:Uncharacterized protein n=1 Tax=Crucibulum laeve TaxID=68775 RepID=A0A5C3LZF6_9AGAR|nr:hypothetical protein BDQ12DRAFT_712971 [Crucibulum laeve]